MLIQPRQAWLDYCLINPSGRPGKFMADDRFGERIILLNKEKVRPSANAKSDEFLREVVALNVMSLWKCREVVSRATGVTSHGNRHSLVAKLPDVSLLVKHMTGDLIFREELGRCGLRNSDKPSAFADPFSDGTARFSSGIALSKYVASARGNWDNYAPVDNVTDGTDDENNDDLTDDEDPGGPPDDDSDELYGVYD